MIIMGVDPGTRFAGYGVLKKGNNISLIDYGCLDIHKKKNMVNKIGTLYEFFSKKVKELEITHIAIETPFLYKNASTFLKLGYVRGILYLIADQNNLEISEFTPCEVKLQITGSGKASKEQVANMVLKYFPIEKTLSVKPQRDDVTDAIAISLCGMWNT